MRVAPVQDAPDVTRTAGSMDCRPIANDAELEAQLVGSLPPVYVAFTSKVNGSIEDMAEVASNCL